MNLSDNGARFIAGHEGMVLQTYNDPANHCTVGIGHLVHKGSCTAADRAQWGKLTEQQAFDLFRSDARRFIDAVAAAVTVPLTQNQFDALTSFSFNVGEGAFRKSTLLRKLNAGDYAGAAAEFPKWNKAGGKVLKGLVRRRAEEAALFRRLDAGGAATIQVPIAAAQSIPRLPGESREVAHMRAYAKASGVPHRVTSTVRSKLPSRHAQQGTDGQGLATDYAGPKPGRNTPELLAVFKAFEPVEHLLYELIYSGASYSIKRGKRVARFAIADHWDHVHGAVDRGTFIQFPGGPSGVTVEDEEDMMYFAEAVKDGRSVDGRIWLCWGFYKVHVGNPEQWNRFKELPNVQRPNEVAKLSLDAINQLAEVPSWVK